MCARIKDFIRFKIINSKMSATQEETQVKSDMFTNEFSREVFESKYKYGSETVEEMQARVAKAIASFETDKEHWEEEFKNLLADFKFIPGGRILSNAGIPIRGTTLINCYVSGFEGEDRDSIDSILDELRRQALILKSEGGYGFCVDTLRPRYSFISGIGSESPGAVKMLDMWDTQSDVITSGSGKKSTNGAAKSGIRKGAQMVTMSIWHPDVEEFISAKHTPGKLSKFNMSVLITDKFMQAVRSHSSWNLIFPDMEADKERYQSKWDGNIEKWMLEGGKVKVYKTFEDAAELWDVITNSTYTRNEPGILFIDRINYWNNLNHIEYICSTNPCVAKGTLVNTPFGYKKVEELHVDDMVCTVLGSEPIANIEVNKDCHVYRVKFSNGTEQIVTAAHMYHAVKKGSSSKYYEPTRLDELTVGDRVRIETTPVNYEYSEDSYKTGLKAGILLGDGCYTEKSVQVRIAADASASEFNTCIKELFGVDSFAKDSIGEGDSMYLMFKKDAVVPEELGVERALAHYKKMSYDHCNDMSYVIGILDGLLATDGTVNLKSNHPSIRFNTTSKQLATDIYNMLIYLGCYSTITSSFDESGVINGREIHRNHLKYTVNVSGSSVKNYFKHTKLDTINKEKYDKIKYSVVNCSLTGNHGHSTIVSIEYAGTEDTYDLYCEESDTWITSGFVQRGCGEQPLPTDGACLLGNLNLTQFVSGDDFDYDKLANTIKVAVRFMDNVNDITYVPLAGQRDNLMKKRRIGLGIMGYASALVMMKIKYGSERALQLTDELMHFITNAAYTCSALLAKEKGKFPLYDESDYLNSNFVKTLSEETRDAIAKHGIRNSHLISIQPTGNTSSLANVVSGGLEPIFRPEYVRTAIVAHWPDYVPALPSVDFAGKKFECIVRNDDRVAENGNWDWIKEGDDNMLRGVFLDGDKPVVYKFDQNRGLTRESIVMDYGVAYLKERGEYEPDAEYMVDSAKLSISDHVNTMTAIAKYVDAAMSKTINIPNDYSFEDFKGVYDNVYDSGVIKGCTTYRDGTMASVLSEIGSHAAGPERITRTKAPKRPKVLDCDIHHLTIGGDKWLVFIGLFGSDPYEVFAFKRNGIQISPKVTSGKLIKVKQRNHQARYDLDLGDITIEDVCSHFKTGEESALTRMISTALRHGADMDYIYDQLMKAEGSIVSFSKAVARAIKKYVHTIHDNTCWECGAENAVIMTEGCMKCSVCGASKC